MKVNVADLRRRMTRLTDEQLLDIVTTHRRAYRQVAHELATAELTRRGVPITARVAATQTPLRAGRRRAALQVQPAENELVILGEILCAVLSSIILVIVFVSERETQKAMLRWAGTSLALPYTVWRGMRALDRRWPAHGGARQGQAIN